MSEIQRSVELLAETLQRKGEDYRGDRGEFYNFEQAAKFINAPTSQAILVEIAKKFTRLESLLPRNQEISPNYESVSDTLLDLAGYAVIAHAWIEQWNIDQRIVTGEWNPTG